MKSKVIKSSVQESEKTFKRLPVYILIIAIIIGGILAFDSWEPQGVKEFHEAVGTISIQQEI